MEDWSHELDEELDAVLDGRRHLYTSELRPAVEVAERLREELATYDIPPEVARDHIARALVRTWGREQAEEERAGVLARLRARWPGRSRPLRRAAVAVALAAALAAVPAVASARALPGQPLYGVKRAIEQAEVTISLTPAGKAEKLIGIAGIRLFELRALVAHNDSHRIPPAITDLQRALDTAGAAVRSARSDGVSGTKAAVLASQLQGVHTQTMTEMRSLLRAPPGSPLSMPAIRRTASSLLGPQPTTSTVPQTTGGGSGGSSSPASTAASSTVGPSSSTPTTTAAPATTTPPPTTTAPPPTTSAPATTPSTEAPQGSSPSTPAAGSDGTAAPDGGATQAGAAAGSDGAAAPDGGTTSAHPPTSVVAPPTS